MRPLELTAWPDFLNMLKRKGHLALYGILQEAQPRFEGSRLVLAFHPKWQWHMVVLKNERARELQEAVALVWPGAAVEVRADAAAAAPGTEPERELKERVERVRAAFNGEIIRKETYV